MVLLGKSLLSALPFRLYSGEEQTPLLKKPLTPLAFRAEASGEGLLLESLVYFPQAVAQASNLLGFSSVDNLVHLGGCLAGFLVGCATIRSLEVLK